MCNGPATTTASGKYELTVSQSERDRFIKALESVILDGPSDMLGAVAELQTLREIRIRLKRATSR